MLSRATTLRCGGPRATAGGLAVSTSPHIAWVAMWQATARDWTSRRGKCRHPMTGERLERLLALLVPTPGSGSPSTRVAAATRVLFTARHVGLVLTSGGILTPLDVGDQPGALHDEQQFSLGDGPTLEATGASGPVIAVDLTHPRGRRRWPLFAPVASGFGVASAVALPLRVGAARLGVLTAYRSQPNGPYDTQFADGIELATIATELLLSEQAGLGEDQLAGEFASGLQSQSVVHQAAGMVSEQLAISVIEALARLRAHAVATGQPLAALSRSIVAGEQALER